LMHGDALSGRPIRCDGRQNACCPER
jgi:hypothetical protein